MPQENSVFQHASASQSAVNKQPKGQSSPPSLPQEPSVPRAFGFGMKKKLMLISFFIVLFLSVIGSGYFYFDFYTKEKAKASETNEFDKEREFSDIQAEIDAAQQKNSELAEQFIPSPIPKPSPLLKNIYTNLNYGVSFEAPLGWEKLSESDELVIFVDPQTVNNPAGANLNFIVDISPGIEDLGTYAQQAQTQRNLLENFQLISSTQETLNEQDYIIDDYTVSSYEVIFRQRQVYTVRGNKAYIFTFSTAPEEWETYLPTFDEVRSSFSFSGAVQGARTGF